MSYAVLRGEPLAAQLYLDGVLNEILEAKGIQPDAQERSKINLPQILYHCLRKNPSDIFMINGQTGERITNEQLLKLSVPLARWLISKGLKGKNAMVVMRSHPRMIALYFALIFAGVVPLFVDSIFSTEFEFIHFLKLIEPVSVFCDEERREKLLQSLQSCPGVSTDVIVADQDAMLEQLYAEHSDSLHNFQVSDASVDSTAMYLPSSGSTGMPKATFISQRGLVVQLPIIWMHHSQFPKPTELVMLMTSIQWMTFTMLMTTCVVYRVPLLTSPIDPSVEYDIELLEKFRPTWTFFGPAFARCLVSSASPDQLTSLETLVLLGEPTTPELISTLREKLPKSTHICDGYGTTETHGFIAIQDIIEVPFKSNGRVINIFNYKLVDDNGQEVGLCQKGELYLKGASIMKGYYKDEKSYNEAVSNGWFKTGDIFYIDDKKRLYYHVKKRFSFKYQSTDVAPEKVERVINAIPGIQESVVCGTEDGAAAAVILRPNTIISRYQIHQAVNAMLSDHMRLHGGIAFVQSLPRTHTGKLKRLECTKLILELIYNGQCILNV